MARRPMVTHNVSLVKADGEQLWWLECRESLEGTSLGRWVGEKVSDPMLAKIDVEMHTSNPSMVRGERVGAPAPKKKG